MKRLLKIDFVRFAIVGALGFVINFILLTILYKKIGMHPFIAQFFSSEVALFSNFLLHHNWTYKHKRVTKSVPKLLSQFHATSWAAIVGSSLIVYFFINILKYNYVIALVVSSGVALLWNFGWSKLVIWRHEHEPQEGKE
jgi:putative flippase GtrA